jgi:hypothetical protein
VGEVKDARCFLTLLNQPAFSSILCVYLYCNSTVRFSSLNPNHSSQTLTSLSLNAYLNIVKSFN